MVRQSIHFFKEDIRFRFDHRVDIIRWIQRTIRQEGFRPGDINIVFCSDSYLRRMNKNYLQHDYNTDIITFETGDDPSVIHGDLFISIDRVKENAVDFSTSFSNELHRVIIHGILHLCNYSDKSVKKQTEMRQREDHYLKRRSWLKK
jgi:probable rRNA maturation factor